MVPGGEVVQLAYSLRDTGRASRKVTSGVAVSHPPGTAFAALSLIRASVSAAARISRSRPERIDRPPVALRANVTSPARDTSGLIVGQHAAVIPQVVGAVTNLLACRSRHAVAKVAR